MQRFDKVQTDKMAKLIFVVLLATLSCIPQSQSLTLFRITRDSTGNLAAIEESQTDVILEENVNENGATVGKYIEVPRALVDTRENILLDYPGTNEDLVLAETHIFRPLFTYRRQVARRMKLKKLADDQ